MLRLCGGLLNSSSKKYGKIIKNHNIVVLC
jgi:hypothetical protein